MPNAVLDTYKARGPGSKARAWRAEARPEQLPPDGDWRIFYIRGGRGGGKTWTGSNALAELIQTSPPGEWAAIGPTYGDARDTLIESAESGLLVALGLPRRYHGWNRSMGELSLPNGSIVYADGADDGALRIQGKNLRGAWCDEVGLWKRWETAWDESLRFAVRKAPAKIIATGTPKRRMPAIKLIRRLMADERVVKTVLLTKDNAAHLDPGTLEDLMLLAGTSFGMQELEGAVLDDSDGGYFHSVDWRYWQHDTEQDGRRLIHLIDEQSGRDERYDLTDCARFITIDLAASLKTSADWTVAGAWAIPNFGDLVLLDRVRARVTETDHAEFVKPLRERWLGRYDVVHVEATMQASTLAYQLGQSGVPWAPLRADKGKLERALPYVKLVRQHRVWLPKDAEWLPEWIDEHAEFPNEQVPDDQVDVGAYGARVRIADWLAPETGEQQRQREATDPDYVDLMTIPL
ncbi:MAG TPA: terminase family protein [Frankiaceae bacterium]|jgi:predicted phage terminase large subunit-like protein|nr:terminase family protein [Frankiaceae bacterium]